MPYGDLQSDAGAVAESEDIRFLDPQVPKEGGHIVRRAFKGERLIAIGRATVPLLLERDNPTSACKYREHSAECDLNRRPTTVKQNEGNTVSAAMHFVVDANTVYWGVAAL